MEEPPSRTWWELDSYLSGGHTVDETICYLDWVSDWEAEQQAQRRALPPGFVPGDAAEPRWLGRLRRLTGRGG